MIILPEIRKEKEDKGVKENNYNGGENKRGEEDVCWGEGRGGKWGGKIEGGRGETERKLNEGKAIDQGRQASLSILINE